MQKGIKNKEIGRQERHRTVHKKKKKKDKSSHHLFLVQGPILLSERLRSKDIISGMNPKLISLSSLPIEWLYHSNHPMKTVWMIILSCRSASNSQSQLSGSLSSSTSSYSWRVRM